MHFKNLSLATRVGLILMVLSGCATQQSHEDLRRDNQAPEEHLSQEALAIRSAQDEPNAWEIAKSSKDADVLNIYLMRFPQGAHVATAKLRLKLIQSGEIR